MTMVLQAVVPIRVDEAKLLLQMLNDFSHDDDVERLIDHALGQHFSHRNHATGAVPIPRSIRPLPRIS